MKVVHIITGLDTGGAEMMLYKLLSKTDEAVFSVEVISLTEVGEVGECIIALGIPVRALGMRRGIPNPLMLLKLARWLTKSSPDLVQTWMYHADLLGGLAARLATTAPVIWGIRQSNLNPASSKKSTMLTAGICAYLSRWLPAKILCCSEAARSVHIGLGYRQEKMCVIANGFDLRHYKPDAESRKSVRQELALRENTLLLGLVARFDAQKDHHTFIRAAAILHTRLPEVHFLLCGGDIDRDNETLLAWINSTPCAGQFHLLGNRRDIPRLSAALDIACSSSSYGEGFPNVLGEAMACAVPCVATDVGDSALIIKDCGKVVAAGDPEAMADAWRVLLELSEPQRRQLGEAGRQRIRENFSLPVIVERYQNLYREVV